MHIQLYSESIDLTADRRNTLYEQFSHPTLVSYHRFGPRQACFFLIANKVSIDHAVSTPMLSDEDRFLPGRYLIITFLSDSHVDFSMGINMAWLTEQLTHGEAAIESALHSLLDEWQEEKSIVCVRYANFQKDYLNTFSKNLLTHAYSSNLLYTIVSDIYWVLSSSIPEKYKATSLRRVKAIGEHILENIQDSPPSIKEMAALAGMSESKFKLVFKEAFGQSPHQYILEKKLEYAEELLATGDYTLTQLAHKLGYSHTSGFTRIYKKKYRINYTEVMA